MEFDEKYWAEAIRRPDWYLEFVPYARKVQKNLGEKSAEAREFRNIVRRFFEKSMLNGSIALAKDGPDMDKQRLPIDTVVIHHTSHKGKYSLDFMEATQLLNIYAPFYADPPSTYRMNPRVKDEYEVKGKPIWSGHFRDSHQTFLCYHWLMRMDGSFIRLLKDDEIGWHAGNWEVNRRSIAICLDSDFDQQDPKDELLKKLAHFISRNYPGMRVIGHREARTGTTCPGRNFIDVWKPRLLTLLAE